MTAPKTRVARRSSQEIRALDIPLTPLIPEGLTREAKLETTRRYAEFLRYRLEARDKLAELKP